jgi:hypothetical protein
MTATVVVRATGLTPPATDTAIDRERDESLRLLVLLTTLIAWIAIEWRRQRRQSTAHVDT